MLGYLGRVVSFAQETRPNKKTGELVTYSDLTCADAGEAPMVFSVPSAVLQGLNGDVHRLRLLGQPIRLVCKGSPRAWAQPSDTGWVDAKLEVASIEFLTNADLPDGGSGGVYTESVTAA